MDATGILRSPLRFIFPLALNMDFTYVSRTHPSAIFILTHTLDIYIRGQASQLPGNTYCAGIADKAFWKQSTSFYIVPIPTFGCVLFLSCVRFTHSHVIQRGECRNQMLIKIIGNISSFAIALFFLFFSLLVCRYLIGVHPLHDRLLR